MRLKAIVAKINYNWTLQHVLQYINIFIINSIEMLRRKIQSGKYDEYSSLNDYSSSFKCHSMV